METWLFTLSDLWMSPVCKRDIQSMRPCCYEAKNSTVASPTCGGTVWFMNAFLDGSIGDLTCVEKGSKLAFDANQTRSRWV